MASLAVVYSGRHFKTFIDVFCLLPSQVYEDTGKFYSFRLNINNKKKKIMTDI